MQIMTKGVGWIGGVDITQTTVTAKMPSISMAQVITAATSLGLETQTQTQYRFPYKLSNNENNFPKFSKLSI